MVIIKTAHDIENMMEACRISAGALRVARETIRPGVSTAYIDGEIRKYILSCGAKPTFLHYGGFPKNTCISINEQVIHGIPDNETVIKDGDIVKVDVGAAKNGFTGDNAATFPVGTVSDEARKLIEVTKESLERGVAAALKGNRTGDIGHAVQSYVEQNGFSVVRDYVGHGVGHELHEDPEVPNYGLPGHGPRLMAGMTIAVEPMINAGNAAVRVLPDGWTVKTADGSLSAHYENSVLITNGEPEILTAPEE